MTIGWLASSFRQENDKMPEEFEVLTAWTSLTNYITKTIPANSPTFASRCFGYLGLTMYKPVVNGYPEKQLYCARVKRVNKIFLSRQ